MSAQVAPQDSTIKDLMATFLLAAEKMSLTPEKLREALKPYEDPAVLAREKRERAANRAQFLEGLEITKQRQASCPHKDKNERWALSLVHNFPDRSARATCPLCEIWIYPAHWVIPGAGFDGGNGLGQPYVVPEHPLYHVVRFLESNA